MGASWIGFSIYDGARGCQNSATVAGAQQPLIRIPYDYQDVKAYGNGRRKRSSKKENQNLILDYDRLQEIFLSLEKNMEKV